MDRNRLVFSPGVSEDVDFVLMLLEYIASRMNLGIAVFDSSGELLFSTGDVPDELGKSVRIADVLENKLFEITERLSSSTVVRHKKNGESVVVTSLPAYSSQVGYLVVGNFMFDTVEDDMPLKGEPAGNDKGIGESMVTEHSDAANSGEIADSFGKSVAGRHVNKGISSPAGNCHDGKNLTVGVSSSGVPVVNRDDLLACIRHLVRLLEVIPGEKVMNTGSDSNIIDSFAATSASIARLRQSEADFRQLFEQAHDAILIFRPESESVVDVNHHATVVYGFTREEFIGMSLLQISVDVEAGKKAIEEVMKGAGTISFETRQRTKEGNIIFLEVKASAISYRGEPAILSINRDVTERKLTEEKLKRSEAKYRELINQLHVGVVVFASDCSVILYNNEARLIFGDEQSLICDYRRYSTTWHFVSEQGEPVDYKETPVRKVIETRKPVADRVMGIVADGKAEVIWTLISAYPEVDDDQNITRVVASFINISEWKKTEDHLAELHRRMNLATQVVGIGIWDWDVVADIMVWDKGMYDLFGAEPDNFSGNLAGWKQRVHPDDLEYNMKAVQNILEQGDRYQAEYRIVLPDGGIRYIHGDARVIRNSNGQAVRMIGVDMDITKLKKSEAELIEARKKAEEVSLLKSRIIANLSHEIRTPLNGIMGMAEYLMGELTDESLQTMARNISQSGNRLLNTLTGIFDLAISESHYQTSDFMYTDINKVVERCAVSFKKSMAEAGLTLVMNLPETDLTTVTIPTLVIKILNNLIHNAIKFTPAGTITISAGRSVSNNKPIVWITVADTGIGIAREHMGIIFEEFRQVSEGASRNYEGTGLGLHVAQRFAQMIGGVIAVESSPGKGSRFTLYIPYETLSEFHPPAREELPDPLLCGANAEGPADRPKILLVEDDEASALVAGTVLELACYVERVTDGEQAIARTKETVFDAILMDINLGNGISGMTAAEQIRMIPGYEGIPIAALTANAFDEQRREYLSRGCTHYLSKPYARRELISLLNNMLGSDVL